MGGGGLKGDPVAEALEAADVAAGLAAGADALLVVTGAELAVGGFRVSRAWTATSWVLMTATRAFFFGMCRSRRPSLAPRKVRGAAGAGDGRAEGCADAEVAAAAGGPAFALPGGFLRARGYTGPGAQVPRGREGAHADPDFGDQVLGVLHAETGNLVDLGRIPAQATED